MAVGEIFAKGLVVIKGDTSHARAEIAKLSAEEQKAAKARIKAQEEHNANLERTNQRFQLYAAGAIAGYALISASVKKYESHLVSLGTKGEAELKRLRDTTGMLTKAQDNLQHSIAKLALEAAPAARALADMANQLSAIVGGVAAVVAEARKLPGASYVGKGIDYAAKYNPVTGIWGGVYAAADSGGIGGLADSIGGAFYDGGPSGVDPNYSWYDRQKMREYELQRRVAIQKERERGSAQARLFANNALARGELFGGGLLRGIGIGTEEEERRSGGGGGRDADWYGSVRARGRMYLGRAAGAVERDEERQRKRAESFAPVDFSLGGIPAQAEMLSGELSKLMEELKGEEAAKEKTALEKIVGPIEQFDAYAIGFGAVTNAATAAYEAIITGSESAGAALKRVAGQEIMAVGKNMLVRSFQEGAWAISDLAKGNLPGAAMHAKSGAMFLAGSLAAGSIAAGLGAGGGGSSAGASNANAAAGIGGGGGGYSGGRERNMSMTVVMGDQFAGDSPRYVARKLRRNLNMARMYADYESEGD